MIDNWVIALIISFLGVAISGVAVLANYTNKVKKEAEEKGNIVTELKHIRKDIEDGGKDTKEHLKFCRSQCQKLEVVERNLELINYKLENHDEMISIHDRELKELKEKSYGLEKKTNE